MIANHGRIAKYDHIMEGRNSRLDGLQAAILSVKLKFLESWLEHRIKISKLYLEGLRNTGDIILPTINKNKRHVFHLFVIRTKYREALRAHLTSKNIETGIHYPTALPKLEAYQYMKKADSNMIANKLDSELLSLPIGEHLSLEQIQEVIEEIDLFLNNKVKSLQFIIFTKTRWLEPPRLRHQLVKLLLDAGHNVTFYEKPYYPWQRVNTVQTGINGLSLRNTKQLIHHKLRINFILGKLNEIFEIISIKQSSIEMTGAEVIINFNYDYYFLRKIFPGLKIITILNDDSWSKSILGSTSFYKFILKKHV